MQRSGMWGYGRKTIDNLIISIMKTKKENDKAVQAVAGDKQQDCISREADG
ncbi:hypothetical protein Barb6_03318 [Bacteroidales bacterium Barb6]|nr:hypothetical protein Barb6_03318 [Bacteroidales bacterium Barb6]